MVPIEMRRKAVRRLRQLLREGGFAQPDQVDYGPTSVTLSWRSVRKAIVVDVDDDGQVGESRGATFRD
jgi:hypothetical protein